MLSWMLSMLDAEYAAMIKSKGEARAQLPREPNGLGAREGPPMGVSCSISSSNCCRERERSSTMVGTIHSALML